ncbi:pirin family protein [Pseudomonas aeruginosa]
MSSNCIPAPPASDGAGVRLTRVIGGPSPGTLRPVPDARPVRYPEPGRLCRRFPSHPHRGFETVTYMLGRACAPRRPPRQRGLLKPRRRTVMISRPRHHPQRDAEQVEGAMRGFQLWVNLPAKSKLAPAAIVISSRKTPRLEPPEA